jgi:hypothetical protein
VTKSAGLHKPAIFGQRLPDAQSAKDGDTVPVPVAPLRCGAPNVQGLMMKETTHAMQLQVDPSCALTVVSPTGRIQQHAHSSNTDATQNGSRAISLHPAPLTFHGPGLTSTPSHPDGIK